MTFFGKLLTALVFTAGLTLFAGPDDVVISEFMAINETTYPPIELSFVDEDKDCADWIEIVNTGSDAVDLTGWWLSDDPNDARRWEFPAKTLDAGQILVVFASGKDRRDPAANLHTSFKLGGGGEYVALATPDGRVVSSHGPSYAQQYTNVSYGYVMDSGTSVVLPSNGPVRVLVPSDDTLGTTWTAADFEDGAWTAGTGGVGYDRKTTRTYASLIGTDVDAAMYSINTSAYIRMPFVLADPSTCDALVLSINHDDGFVAYINGTEVARSGAPATLAWNSATSVTHDGVTAEKITIWGARRLLRAGTNVLAIHGMNRSPSTQNDFVIAASLEAKDLRSVDTTHALYFDAPTPGEFNAGAGFTRAVDEPRPSHPPGCYNASFQLTLAVDAPDAVIRYTTNRSVPTESSTEYTGPIAIANTVMIRARAFAPGCLPSPLVSYTYSILLDATTTGFSSDLPVMVINTFGAVIDQAAYKPIQVFLAHNPRGRTSLSDFAPLASRAGLKIRGSTAADFPKKMYSLELWNERDKEQATSLLGMPEDSDWILYPAYNDKTLMRDVLAYELSNSIGRWASHTHYMEMFMNSGTTGMRYSTHYLGIYALVERIKRGSHRVPIERLYASQKKEPEISGGYILKNDRLDPLDSGFATSGGGYSVSLCYVYPHEKQATDRPPQEVATTEQKTWIKSYLDRFQVALYGANFKDPNVGYAAYIDPLSFIDHMLIVELSKNIDGYRLSTFMYKDKNGKLNMGPVWDYNLSFGNADYNAGWLTNTWYYDLYLNSMDEFPWYKRLMEDPAFLQLRRERWFELRAGPLSLQAIMASIDAKSDLLREAQARNFKRWPVLGVDLWPNWYVGPTWESEVIWMKNWIRDRLLWIDSQFLTAPVFSHNGGAIEPGLQLTITGTGGAIMYTLNGPDPSDPGIQGSPQLLTYSGPITIALNTRVRARIQAGGAWSALKEATFVVATPRLVITEIMYNPKPVSPYTTSQLEFVELMNAGDTPIDLPGAKLAKGVTFEFPASGPDRLDPGEYVVVARDLNAFTAVHGSDGITVVAPWTGTLSDAGEALQTIGPLGEACVDFTYRDTWYPQTDLGGYSLVFSGPLDAPLADWGNQANWACSALEGGSPGQEDPQGGRQLPGDANQDGRLNISDGITYLKMLFGSASPPLPCAGASMSEGGNLTVFDVNGDSATNIADVVYLLGYLFSSGLPPAYGTGCVPVVGCNNVCLQ